MATLLSYALTNLADVKETLGIASSDTSWDNLIIRKINQATEMIEKYTGRRFKLTTYTDEEYDSTGSNQLILRQRPVTALTSISSRDTSFNTNDWDSLDTDYYFLDANAGVVDLNFTQWGRWNRWKVTYTAGYTDIPSDIQEAAVTLAANLTLSSETNSNVKSMTEGQRKVEYFENSGAGTTGDLFDELNISQTLNAYSNNPILADK